MGSGIPSIKNPYENSSNPTKIWVFNTFGWFLANLVRIFNSQDATAEARDFIFFNSYDFFIFFIFQRIPEFSGAESESESESKFGFGLGPRNFWDLLKNEKK